MMRSPEEGSLSATTQVKVLSPEITHIAQGQGFHILETSTEICARGQVYFSVPGSESVADRRIDFIGTWENRSIPAGKISGAEEATKNRDNTSVVGQIHSRGVGRVMPVESLSAETLEGICRSTQRDGV